MIYNKSVHPIEVKKISIRIWGLRDEIEAAIGRRMKECEAAGVPLYIEDIKKFYSLESPEPQAAVLSLIPPSQEEDGIASLMESIVEEVKTEAAEAKTNEEAETIAPEEIKPEAQEEKVDTIPSDITAAPGADSAEVASIPVTDSENKVLSTAEEIIASQTLQGLETKKPNPILERPYQRQAPDLDKISYGFTLLSDINMEHMMSFTKDRFLQGQSVVLEFLIPRNFMMTASVGYCNHFALRSKIISSTKPDYRLQSKFSFHIQGERENLRSFLKSIEPTIPAPKKKVPKETEDDSLGL